MKKLYDSLCHQDKYKRPPCGDISKRRSAKNQQKRLSKKRQTHPIRVAVQLNAGDILPKLSDPIMKYIMINTNTLSIHDNGHRA